MKILGTQLCADPLAVAIGMILVGTTACQRDVWERSGCVDARYGSGGTYDPYATIPDSSCCRAILAETWSAWDLQTDTAPEPDVDFYSGATRADGLWEGPCRGLTTPTLELKYAHKVVPLHKPDAASTLCVAHVWCTPQYTNATTAWLDGLESIDVQIRIRIPSAIDTIDVDTLAHMNRIGATDGRLGWIYELPGVCPDHDVENAIFSVIGPVTYNP